MKKEQSKNKILYISLTGMGEALGQSQVLEYLLPIDEEFDIFLLSYEREEESAEVRRLISKSNVHWTSLPYSNKYGLVSAIFILFQGIFKALRIAKKQNIDIVHCRSMIPSLIGLLVRFFFNSKLIFDIRGFATDEKVDRQRIKKNSLLYYILIRLEKLLYKKADHIVTLTYKAKDLLQEQYPFLNNKSISVIPTCASKQTFKTLSLKEKQTFREQLGLDLSHFVFIHTGNVGTWYEFEKELVVIKELYLQNPFVRFIIVNKGQHDFIHEKIKALDIPKECILLTSSTFSEVYKYVNIADYALFFIKPSFSKQASAPTKFAENIACYLPTISNGGVGDMEYFLTTYHVGLCVDTANFDAKMIANQILEAPRNYPKEEFDKLFDKEFDKELAIKKYKQIYSKL